MEQRFFFLQRVTALILAPLVLIHLVVIMYAVRGGLTTADILSRTQGSFWWISFYAVFVVTVAIHAAIGIRRVLIEWGRLSPAVATFLGYALCLLMLFLGGRAVIAVGGI